MEKFTSKLNKNIDRYTIYDFVQYFGYLYYYMYEQVYNPKMPKDNINMKKVRDEFITHGRGNLEMIKFIDWAIKEKSIQKGTKMTIGFLPSLTKEYMKIHGYINVFDEEIKEQKKKMNKEIEDWIRKERKKFKNGQK